MNSEYVVAPLSPGYVSLVASLLSPSDRLLIGDSQGGARNIAVLLIGLITAFRRLVAPECPSSGLCIRASKLSCSQPQFRCDATCRWR